ncbi:Cof-type HAD-IIB family hydrolase [Paenibacillus thiaminolyticus]|uniref:Cof-type HAD-IIB family hydrolase n=1 Tax=Paenibacillus thiaminolyticus TaxID=49283 RepID=UPI00116506F1|nr:Cof-type HAD-IIB family hydrolase [Paenibacillus thiaminolyticus]NGP59178.1 Cof-type HAD-IIB family hydrolase [Paenibacillus thiaminolyticus]
MSYNIVFFDIDGTLVNDEKRVPQNTVEAIAELKKNGVEPVIATGRAPYFFKPLAEQLQIESFVSLNGAYVVYKGDPLYQRPLPRKSVAKLVELAGRHRHPLVFEGSEQFYANDEAHPFVVEAIDSLRIDRPGHDPEFWSQADIYQVFLHCEAQDEHLYDNVFDDLRLIRWHSKAMDVLIKGGSKAVGIKAMLERLNLAPENAVAFGDGLNDMEMLQQVGLGIAMGNSHPELLPFADYVTSSVDEGGIRQGLRHAGLIN